jgi:hypothetical protein
MEIDFSNQIIAKNLDELKYTDTPEVYLKTSRSNFKYLDIDLKPLLDMPPPANSSERTRRELLDMKSFMEKEHSEEFKSNLRRMDEGPAKFVIDSYESLSNRRVPKGVLKFIASGDVEVLVMKLKMHYLRPRPYQLAAYHGVNLNYNKKVQNGAAATPSYPSGHTMAAYFAARAIGYVEPDYESELMEKSKMVADSRVFEGVHFVSDNMFSFYLVDRVLMPAFIGAYEQ